MTPGALGSALGKLPSKASPEQLHKLEQAVVSYVPKFFQVIFHPYEYYTQDVTFINNMRGTKTQGLKQYATQLSLIKLNYLIRYSSNKVELLNLVKSPEESYIKFRWRIISKPGFTRFFLTFWKYHSTDIWTDGISTIHVNNQGKIHCHVCDNIDIDVLDVKEKQRPSVLQTPLNLD